MPRTVHYGVPFALALAFLAGCTDAATAPTLKPIDATHLYAVGDEPPPPPPPSDPAPATSSDTVVSMESAVNALAAELARPASGGVLAPPTDGGAVTLSTPFSAGTLGGFDATPMSYPLPTCDITAADETECIMTCLDIRYDFQNANRDFWYADNDFWNNWLTGRSYLTGRSLQTMTTSLQTMRQKQLQFKSNVCSLFLR